MGLFLSMSGIAGASRSEIEEALSTYATENGGHFQTKEGLFQSPNIMAIVEGEDQRFTILYPWNFYQWDDASAFLSRTLGTPVFSLHIHDEDLWMYVLFVDGDEADLFNPIPDYWSDELTDEEITQWAGDANLLSRVWTSIEEEEVRNYLVRWDLDDDEPGNAYPYDRYGYNDCFQMYDFMKRFGLKCPIDDQGQVLGETYCFEIPSGE